MRRGEGESAGKWHRPASAEESLSRTLAPPALVHERDERGLEHRLRGLRLLLERACGEARDTEPQANLDPRNGTGRDAAQGGWVPREARAVGAGGDGEVVEVSGGEGAVADGAGDPAASDSWEY